MLSRKVTSLSACSAGGIPRGRARRAAPKRQDDAGPLDRRPILRSGAGARSATAGHRVGGGLEGAGAGHTRRSAGVARDVPAPSRRHRRGPKAKWPIPAAGLGVSGPDDPRIGVARREALHHRAYAVAGVRARKRGAATATLALRRLSRRRGSSWGWLSRLATGLSEPPRAARSSQLGHGGSPADDAATAPDACRRPRPGVETRAGSERAWPSPTTR